MKRHLSKALLFSVGLSASLACGAFTSTAQAEFVQTMTCSPTMAPRCDVGEEPKPVRWFQQVVTYNIHYRGTQDIHPGESEITDELRDAVIESFETWNDPDCSDFEMHFDAIVPEAHIGTEGGSVAIDDLSNVVVWRDQTWPQPGYNAVALTTVTFRPSTGKILAADIEFNTADYQFTNTNSPDETIIDIRNTLTHEVGHFLGLDHSPNNQATMFATAPPGELSKRVLHEADINGLCHIYPTGGHYDIGDGNDGEGQRQSSSRWRWCSATGTLEPGSVPPFVLVLIALSGFVVLRRRN